METLSGENANESACNEKANPFKDKIAKFVESYNSRAWEY